MLVPMNMDVVVSGSLIWVGWHMEGKMVVLDARSLAPARTFWDALRAGRPRWPRNKTNWKAPFGRRQGLSPVLQVKGRRFRKEPLHQIDGWKERGTPWPLKRQMTDREFGGTRGHGHALGLSHYVWFIFFS